MIPNRSGKHRNCVAPAAMLALLGLAGCETRPNLSAFEPLAGTNGRTAYMVNEAASGGGSFKDPVKALGTASSTVTKNGTLTQVFDTQDIHDTNGFVQTTPNTYVSASGTGFTEVTTIADVDKNGTPDDTFLLFTMHNPVSAQRTEYSATYGGTRTDSAFVQQLKPQNHMASYKGSATVVGAFGGAFIRQQGDLTMDVLFTQEATRHVNGRIGNLTNQADTPPEPINAYTFGGNVTSEGADYRISSFRVLDAAGQSVTQGFGNDVTGAGSFFGPKAGGTVGVIAAEGQTLDSKPVNLLTTFTGSTTDNNGK